MSSTMATTSMGSPLPHHRSNQSIGQYLRDKIRSRSKSPQTKSQPLTATANSTDLDGTAAGPYPNGIAISTTPTPKRRSTGHSAAAAKPPLPPTSPGRLKRWLRTSSTSEQQTHNTTAANTADKNKANGHVRKSHTQLNGDTVDSPTTQHRQPFGSFVARISNRWKLRSPANAPASSKNPLLAAQLDPRETQSEEDLVSKSLASEIVSSLKSATGDSKSGAGGTAMVVNGKQINGAPPAALGTTAPFYSQESMAVDEQGRPHHQPSYLRVSRALCGYGYRSYQSTSQLNAQTPRSERTLLLLSTRPDFSNVYASPRYPQTANDSAGFYSLASYLASTHTAQSTCHTAVTPTGLVSTGGTGTGMHGAIGTAHGQQHQSAGRSIVERRLDKFEHPTDTNKQSAAHSASANKPYAQQNGNLAAELAELHNVSDLTRNFGPQHHQLSNDHTQKRQPLTAISDLSTANDTTEPPSSLSAGLPPKPSPKSLSAASSGGGKNRPNKPPPQPPVRKDSSRRSSTSNKDRADLVPSPTGSSSAPTDTCMTGPLTDDNNSLLEDVLKASENIWSDSVSTGAEASSMPVDHQHQPQPCTSNGAVKDGRHYEQCSRTTRGSLNDKCVELETLLDSGKVSDEAAGYIRLAVGKARLLMRKKLAKFDELVQKNLHPIPDDPCPALLDDLTGYWDLLQIDLADVAACFDAVEEYRVIGWKPMPNGKQPVIASQFAATSNDALDGHNNSSMSGAGDRSGSASPSPRRPPGRSQNASSTSLDKEAAKARDIERRKKLAQAKMQGKRQQQNKQQSGDVQIFVS